MYHSLVIFVLVTLSCRSSLSSTANFQTLNAYNSLQLPFYRREPYHCICDKDPTACDLNCCCDVDCAPQDVSTFTSCDEEKDIRKNRRCSEMNPLSYLYHIPILELELYVSDVLCIEYDNYRQNDDSTSLGLVTSVDQLIRYPIPDSLLNAATEVRTLPQGYLLGSAIYVCKTDSGSSACSLGYFTIPQMSVNGLCSNSPMAYMVNKKFTCWRRIEDRLRFVQSCQLGSLPYWLLDSTYTSGFRVVKDASLVSSIFGANTHQQTTGQPNEQFSPNPDNITVPVRTKCRNYLTNEVVPCPSSQTFQTNRFIDDKCTNVVIGVSWTVAYSYKGIGSDGIQEVRAEIFLGNVSQDDLMGFSQIFSVSFHEIGELYASSFHTSGQPGYVFGKPVLAGRLEVSKTEEQENAQRISKTSSRINVPASPEEWLTTLSIQKSSGHECSMATRQPVLFGVNTFDGCYMPFKETCAMTQQAVKKILFGSSLRHDQVGMFGNSNASQPGEWVHIRNSDYGDSHISSDSGTTGFCANLQTGVTLRISYVYSGSLKAPQPQIIDAVYEFDKVPAESTWVATSSVFVKFAVVFDEISQPATPEIAPIRQLEHYLPSDFFYPFFINTGELHCSNISIVLFCLMLSFYSCCVMK